MHVFDGGGSTDGGNAAVWDRLASREYGAGYGDAGKGLSDYMSSKNWLGLSKEDNPFSKGNLMSTFSKEGIGKMINGGLGSGIASTVGGIAGNLIGGGYESGVGKLMGSAGKLASALPGPYGMVASFGLQTLGGVANALLGTKVDQAKLNAANEGTSAYNGFRSNASSLDAVTGPTAQANVQDAYSGGVFRKGWARDRNEALRQERTDARQLAFRSIDNNVDNLMDDQMNNALANYAAFGGPIESTGMGAVDYDFMKDYLLQKKRETDTRNKMGGISSMPAFMPQRGFAFGGDLQTNGSDFPSGLVHINAGQSHELNPNEGVQVGTDGEGVPNLVEENETIWNDYVFSARIPIDQKTKELFHIGKKREMTYADLSKKLEKEIAERPDDPVSKAGFEKQMEMLEQQQERQKQEMEAERAKAAFDALSPEEQTALMQQRAEQEAMAQQQAAMQEAAAQQQPTPEGLAIAQQQQQMADGSAAALGQEPQMAANGGKLFAPGGYLWDKFWSPVNEHSKKKGNTKGKYQIDKEWKGNIKKLEDSAAYKAFTDYILNDATDDERMKYFQWIDANTGRDNKYITDGKLVDNWKDMYQAARTDGLYGIQHYTPEFDPNLNVTAVASPESPVVTTPSPASTPRVFHAMVDEDDYIQGELDPNVVGAEVRRQVLDNGDTVIYHDRVKAPGVGSEETEGDNTAPRHKAGWLRYAGLFGPAVGLGMQAFGIGKPDTSSFDAAVQGAGDVTTASYKPLGNYLTYRPLDIWYEQNALNAQARATDRAIMNQSSPSRMAGLLANGYNSQLASGNLFRQAQEYNDALRQRVEEFNRGTDQYNSEQYGRTSQFNADAYNRARQANAQMRLQAAAQKSDMDAGWNQGIYGNVSGLFKGLSDLGRENEQFNWLSDLAADGAFGNLGRSNTGRRWTKDKKAKGGRMKRRGLTF